MIKNSDIRINSLLPKAVFFFLIIFIPLSFAEAQQQGAQRFPSLDASPRAYELARLVSANNVQNNVQWRNLAEASLWASSVNAGQGAEQRALAYMDRINAAAAELAAASDLPRDPKERGDYVLNFMHRRFLRNYSELQTRVDEIFISGRYNCVSSAVLYMVLAQSVGLDVEGVMTRKHAFVTVAAGSERIDVETTNRFGFDPGNRRDFHDAFGRTTGFAYVPAGNYRDRTAISPVELISLILSNRIAVHERANRFADAVPLAINRAAFLSGHHAVQASSQDALHKAEFFEDSQTDIMNRLFNLGAFLIRNGNDDDAIAWVEYAEGRFPEPVRWQELINAAANNKLVRLIRARRVSEARSELTVLQPKLNREQYLELDSLVLDAEILNKVNTIRNPGDVQTALDFLVQNWERLPPERRLELRTAAIITEADRYARARDWSGGMRWLEASIEQYGANARMETALRTMRQNRISELHNEFAVLFNRRDYTGALASAQRSLQEFPAERQLQQNLSRAERALQQ